MVSLLYATTLKNPITAHAKMDFMETEETPLVHSGNTVCFNASLTWSFKLLFKALNLKGHWLTRLTSEASESGKLYQSEKFRDHTI